MKGEELAVLAERMDVTGKTYRKSKGDWGIWV